MNDVDPPRLRDGDGPLADLLRQGHDDLPDAGEMEPFFPRLDPPPTPPTPLAPPSTPLWLKAAGSLGVIATVAGLGLSLRPAPSPPAAVTAVSGAAPSSPLPAASGGRIQVPYMAPSDLAASAEPPRPPAPSSEPPRLAARSAAVASPPVSAVASSRPASVEPPPSALAPAPSAAGPDPMLELTLLDRARRQSVSSPAEALALVAEHTRLFPRSSFGLEREVIAIEALARSGRRPEAQDRARRLLDASPRSAYRERLERLLR